MKKFRACVLLALFVATASCGLVFGTCALDPKGSCSILGFNPVQPDLTGEICTRWNERESTWYKFPRSGHSAPDVVDLLTQPRPAHPLPLAHTPSL